MNKKAFTLAEVLITLTIIGVIAAMTIPNLMQSYRKHQVEVGVKEAYTILSNALTMSKAEHGALGDLIESSNSNAVFFSQNYLEPYLKISSKCEGGDTSCKMHRGYLKCVDGTICQKTYTYVDGGYTLANGMYVFPGTAADNNHKSFSFAVDINGKQGPNQIGHDIFYFALEYDYPNRLLGSVYSRQLSRGFEYYYSCSRSNGGVYCINPIMYNNWKIPDDYPVKKW